MCERVCVSGVYWKKLGSRVCVFIQNFIGKNEENRKKTQKKGKRREAGKKERKKEERKRNQKEEKEEEKEEETKRKYRKCGKNLRKWKKRQKEKLYMECKLYIKEKKKNAQNFWVKN